MHNVQRIYLHEICNSSTHNCFHSACAHTLSFQRKRTLCGFSSKHRVFEPSHPRGIEWKEVKNLSLRMVFTFDEDGDRTKETSKKNKIKTRENIYIK